MGKDQELLEAARKGNVAVVEKILGQRAKRSGPLARWVRISCARIFFSITFILLHRLLTNQRSKIVDLFLYFIML